MEETTKKKRPTTATIRKSSKNGVYTQKMKTFRLDNENIEWLAKQENQGRYINELIAKDRQNKTGQ